MTTPSEDRGVHPSAYGCITVPGLLIVALMLGWGARTQWMNGALLREGRVVEGRVSKLEFVASNPGVGSQGTRGGNARGVSPFVTFVTVAGETRTAIGSVNRYPPPWSVGDHLDVVYDPADSTRADLVSEVAGWRFWFGFWCAIALAPLAIAMLPIYFRLRQR